MGRAYVEPGSESDVALRRAVAGAIDSIMAIGFGVMTTQLSEGLLGPIGGPVLGTLAVLTYFAYFEGSRGQPLGKLVAGIAVVSTTGRPCGFKRAALRNVVRVVDFLPVAYVLGGVLIARTERSQRLGDLLAGTIVGRVRRDPRQS